MSIYKCNDCANEYDQESKPVECDICGSKSLMSLKNSADKKNSALKPLRTTKEPSITFDLKDSADKKKPVFKPFITTKEPSITFDFKDSAGKKELPSKPLGTTKAVRTKIILDETTIDEPEYGSSIEHENDIFSVGVQITCAFLIGGLIGLGIYKITETLEQMHEMREKENEISFVWHKHL